MTTRRAGFVLALTFCAGHALAGPGALDRAALAAADRALALDERDRGVMAAVAAPALPDFSRMERAGAMERSGVLAVRLKPREEMGRQIVREQAALRAAPRAAADLGGMIEARVLRARERLAPSLIESFEDVDEHRVRVPAGMTEEQLAALLLATGDYAEAAPDWLVYPAATTPNDAQFGNQYHHAANHLNTVAAWDFVTGTGATIIGTCDTGLRTTHQDIASSFVDGFNAVDNLSLSQGGSITDINGHGTGATGCAAAVGNNGVGVAGMGWNFGILHSRVTNSSAGSANITHIKRGIRWAADNGAVTISASYSGVTGAGNVGNYCTERGAQLFWSSGNDGLLLDGNVDTDIVVVGACGSNGQYTSFSNYGPQVDVVAHGVSVRSTSRSNDTAYTWFGGTSAAAPLANGAAALLFAANPDLSPAQVRQIMYETATDLGAPGRDDLTGWGRVNAGAGVIAALTGDFTTPLPFSDDFEGGPLNMAMWSNAAGAVVNADAVNEPSGANSLNLGDGDSLSTVRLGAGGAPADLGFSFMLQTTGLDSDDALTVDYFDGSAWMELARVQTDGEDFPEFTWIGDRIPAPAHNDQLRLRLTGEDGGQWYVDDVAIGSLPAAGTPLREAFESDPSGVLWPSGVERASGAATGDLAGVLDAPQALQTGAIDTTALMGGAAFLSVEVSAVAAEAGDQLVIEALDASLAWQPVATITSDGVPDAGYALHEVEMDLTWIHDAFAVRFTPTGDQTAAWKIDNLYVGPTGLDTGCGPADIDANGTVNVDDVEAFVAAFVGGGPAADVDGNGMTNVDDVEAFVAAFLAGCP